MIFRRILAIFWSIFGYQTRAGSDFWRVGTFSVNLDQFDGHFLGIFSDFSMGLLFQIHGSTITKIRVVFPIKKYVLMFTYSII